MKKRPLLHLHPSTLALCFFVAAGLLWLNFNGRPADALCKNSYGWPVSAYNLWGPPHEKDNDILPNLHNVYIQLGAYFGYVPNEWNYTKVAYDLGVCFFSVALLAVICEHRKRRAGALPSLKTTPASFD